jgi:HK97 family phage prohead protease
MSKTEKVERKVERRAVAQRATVTKRDDQPPVITGYAAVFFNDQDPGTEYQLTPDITEHIDPRCFHRALAEQQAVRCLVNHDANYRIGRCDKGSLRLRCDERGLAYEADVPDTQVGRDTVADLDNGNLDGSSFSFAVRDQVWEDIQNEDGSWRTIRTIRDVDLFDVGPVAFPAYDATTAGLRSTERREDVVAQRDAWRASQRAAAAETEAAAVRARVVETTLVA